VARGLAEHAAVCVRLGQLTDAVAEVLEVQSALAAPALSNHSGGSSSWSGSFWTCFAGEWRRIDRCSPRRE
jgi:hypothetical protein